MFFNIVTFSLNTSYIFWKQRHFLPSHARRGLWAFSIELIQYHTQKSAHNFICFLVICQLCTKFSYIAVCIPEFMNFSHVHNLHTLFVYQNYTNHILLFVMYSRFIPILRKIFCVFCVWKVIFFEILIMFLGHLRFTINMVFDTI